MELVLLVLMAILSGHCASTKDSGPSFEELTEVTVSRDSLPIEKLYKSEDEWRTILNDKEYYVLRQKGTERAFSGAYWDNKDKGTYVCRACELPLFESDTKFKSGTGWPSFWQPITRDRVEEIEDRSHGMLRTEVVCARCEGHLGHVFADGPEPTGLRYCINSVSLNFVKQE